MTIIFCDWHKTSSFFYLTQYPCIIWRSEISLSTSYVSCVIPITDSKIAKSFKTILNSNITKLRNQVSSTTEHNDVVLLKLFEVKTMSLQKKLSLIFDSIFLHFYDKYVNECTT